MADLEFYQDDPDENTEDDYGFESGLGEAEDLTPLQRLEKYLDSDNIFNRQMLARSLLDTLRAVYDSEDSCVAVLDAMSRLSEDPEPSVRSELMEQVPHIAVYCQESRLAFDSAVPSYILPMVVRYLNDSNSQVRKTSQAALLVLLEQGLVEKNDIEQQVVHVILELAAPESLDDYRSEAAALMSKMAPLLGKDITERHFLPKFSEMCTDPLFHVRKVCAANFGEVATVVGVKNCEEVLLPKFYYLCEDGVWGVRKACAECFMTVSCACSLETRKNELANLFVNLLCDQSRWVRMSAFQQLGPFISTFADAESTGLFVNEDGSLSFKNVNSLEGDLVSCSVEKVNSNTDLSGILQFKSLGCTSFIGDSDAQLELQDKYNIGATDVSNNSRMQDEAMLVDSDDKIESDFEDILLGKGKLVFDLIEKSIEEIRAESAEYISSKQVNSRLEILEQEEVLNVDNVHSIHCDISNSNTSVSENIVASSPEVTSDQCQASFSINQTSDLIDELKCPLKCDIPQDAGSGDSSGREGSFCVPYSDNDSDSVFMDNSQEKSASIRTLGSGDDFSSDRVHVHLDNNFNTFQYWRSPLPEVNIDFDIINGQPTNIHVVAKVKDEDSKKIYSSEMNVSISGSVKPRVDSVTDSLSGLSLHNSTIQASSHSSIVMSDVEKSGVRIHTASVSTVSDIADETVSHIGSTHVIGQHLGEQHLAIVGGVVQDLSNGSINFMDDLTSSVDFGLDDASLAQQQSIVPQLLLENYLGMVDPSRAQTVDGEITKHCAYNIPAVAYTLGRQNWHCIKNLYERLAQDMQWKVRRTLAFSMHELAMIVGEDITHTDLVPVFDGFLKDLDEVRIGVLKHLADIFKLLRPEVRLQYLSRTPEFMKTDNQRNWRFREELAEQLIQICDLFHCIDVVAHVVPLVMEMLTDKVAQVRLVALKLLCAILKKTYQDEERKLLTSICNDIIEKFATDERWLCRQTFAQLCYTILEDNSLPPDVFSRNFLPSLLALSVDPVPNVRLSLAKVMSQRIMPLEYFTSQQNPYHEDLVQTQQRLQTDTDKDVRYFASQHPGTDLTHSHDMVPV